MLKSPEIHINYIQHCTFSKLATNFCYFYIIPFLEFLMNSSEFLHDAMQFLLIATYTPSRVYFKIVLKIWTNSAKKGQEML